MNEIRLHKTVGVQVGGQHGVQVGGGAPVVVQSMTMTDTADARATAAQCIELAEAGSEMVRVTVNLPDAAAARPRDQAAHARCRLHRAAHRRFPLQRPPAAHASTPTARPRSTSTGSIPATSGPASAATSSSRRSAGGGRPRQAGAHRRQRRLAQPGARGREDAGEHRSRPRQDAPRRSSTSAWSCRRSSPRRWRSRRGLAQGPDHHLVQDLAAARSHRASTGRWRAQTDQPLHLGLTEAGMGVKGLVWSASAMGVLLERRHRRHDPRLAHAPARRRPPRGGVRGLRAAAGARPALVLAERHRVPGLRTHDEHDVSGTRRAGAGLRAREDAGMEDAVRGRRDDDARRHGLRRQRTRRIEGGQHRDQPAGHRRGAQLPGVHRRPSTPRRCAGRTTSSPPSSSSWWTTTSPPDTGSYLFTRRDARTRRTSFAAAT